MTKIVDHDECWLCGTMINMDQDQYIEIILNGNTNHVLTRACLKCGLEIPSVSQDNIDSYTKQSTVITVERTIRSLDNRDGNITWLWISDREYVEVDIAELVDNAKENNPQ